MSEGNQQDGNGSSDKRTFAITAFLGCGAIILLLGLVAVPLILGASFFPIFRENTRVQVTQSQEIVPSQTEIRPTFTPSSIGGNEGEAGFGGGGLPADTLTRLYEKVGSSVVNIRVFVQQQNMTGQGAGSGFILDDQGHIVTNNHVVAEANLITVLYSDGLEQFADVVGRDPDSDLAILKVDQLPEGAVPIPLGDSDTVEVGEWVVAIGNPFGRQNSLTVGIVSAVGRSIPTGVTPFQIPQAVQTDAAINPGNSGGPLINLDGEVIGVNAQIASSGVQANAGVGFAIPSNVVRLVAPSLIAEGSYQWPWLGVRGGEVTAFIQEANELSTQQGAYIHQILTGGPAEAAEMQGSTGQTQIEGVPAPVGGDVVIAVNGEPIRGFNDLLAMVAFSEPNASLELTLLRDGEEMTITVQLEPRPSSLPNGN